MLRTLGDRLTRGPLIFGIVAGIFLWPLVAHPSFIPARPGEQATDLLLSHWPNAAYVRWAMTTHGQWPLWQANILGGQPFAANPLAGLWYPPNLVLFMPALPLAIAFNVLFLLHVAWAGYGLFRLLLAEGLPVGPAFFGGLVFAGTPKLLAHLGAGHVSLVFAVAWTPWLLLSARRVFTDGGWRSGAVFGLVQTLIILADVRWMLYSIVLALVVGLLNFVQAGSARPAGRRLFYALLTSASLTLSLSAILLLPLAELVRHASRGALTSEAVASYSLPPYPYLLGLVIPLDGVIHEWVTYVGLAPVGLALVGMWRQPVWLGVALVAGAFSLGTNFFLFPLALRWVPGLWLLRVPPRAWFIVALAVSILAAHGLNRLLLEGLPYLKSARLRLLTQLLPTPRLLLGGLLAFTLADLLRANASLFTARPLPAPTPAAQWLSRQPGFFRVYSPSASLPQPDSLQHAEGVDPLHLTAFTEFMARASGIPADRYSVSVPTVFVDDPLTYPEQAQAAAAPNADGLGRLNVRYIATEFPLTSSGFHLARQLGTTRVYENQLARPRAWLVGGEPATLLTWSPNLILISARGPGQLILSEVNYPGWEARLDDQAAPLDTVDGLLQGVQLGPGAHTVRFEFRPRSLYTGAALMVIGLITLGGLWLWSKHTR